MVPRILIALILAFSCAVAIAALPGQPGTPVIYPKNNSVVGEKVNLVLDPTNVSFFQAFVGDVAYPVVDTSTGNHALQGIELKPGVNTIKVRVLTPLDGEDRKKTGLEVVSVHEIKVFSMVELFTGRDASAGFTKEPFHTREREADCAGCHKLEAAPQHAPPAKPEDMICNVCHRKIPEGKYVHGPAAVWNCLACHNPDLYPAKYQFTSADPWKVSKFTQSVEPMVFTAPSAELFKAATAVFASKDKAKEMMKDVLSYIAQSPGDRVRLEVHTDSAPLKKEKGKKTKGFKDNQALSEARAKALAALFKESKKVNMKKLVAVGMGDKLPKAPNTTKEGRELNNRVEIVVYPPDVKVVNSMKLPVIKDRERVVISASYSQGPHIKKLRVVEKLPKGLQYLKGSGFFNGRTKEPRIKGDELIWELGDPDTNFVGTLFYVVKKNKKSPPVPAEVKIVYANGTREMTREFDPKSSPKQAWTVREACMRCHAGIMEGQYKHGPADAGFCNVCHNPHASPNLAWLRKPVWDLCVTCHSEKAAGVHVVAGVASGDSHPTRRKRDPARPGKRMSCVSCHNPHAGESPDLYAYDIKTRYELCGLCHRSKVSSR